jgi:hypothetical protein
MIFDRSLKDRTCHYVPLYESHMITLERLADGGFFKNNRQMIVDFCWPSLPRFFRVIRSMTNLEKIDLLHWGLSLTEDLPQLFRSCPKLTELRLKLVESYKTEMREELKNELKLTELRLKLVESFKSEMCEELKNELRPGFERLRLFELKWEIDSWPAIQEIFT